MTGKPFQHVAGTVLAEKYSVVRPLGRGGFGEVYLVESLSTNAPLALKVLSPEHSGEAKQRDSLLNEIRVMHDLQHKFIVQIQDAGWTEQGNLYYAMEYYDGETLGEILRREKTLSVKRTVSILGRVLRGLRKAHKIGVQHRDIKPDNLMITEVDGRESVRILDFGVARHLRDLDWDSGFRGTAAYCSELILRGEKSGPESDLYSVGVILYQCLTGERPYPGQTRKEVLAAIETSRAPSPEEINPELVEHPALVAVVNQAISLDESEQFRSARKFFTALVGSIDDPRADRFIADEEAKRLRKSYPGAGDYAETHGQDVPEASVRKFDASDVRLLNVLVPLLTIVGIAIALVVVLIMGYGSGNDGPPVRPGPTGVTPQPPIHSTPAD